MKTDISRPDPNLSPIRIKPDDAKAHYNLGIAYLILNDRTSALEVYKVLKTIDVELANRLFNMIYR